jgi:galactokinase/mevalonate kinase-like predicted kinase
MLDYKKEEKYIIMHVSVIINEPIDSYTHVMNYGTHNIQIKCSENSTSFSQYVAGVKDKERFINYIRNMYTENYGGYEAIVINMSDKLKKIILKGSERL